MSNTAQQTFPFDAGPLTAPVAPAELKRFRQWLKTQQGSARTGTVASWVIGGAVAAIFAVNLLLGAGALFSSAAQGNGSAATPMIVMVVFAGIVVAIVVGIIVSSRRTTERRYRIAAFARANAMDYAPSLSTPALPGMIFQIGDARASSDLVRGERPRFVEFGNYQYTTGSGKNKTTHRWGYVAIRLDTPLPHIVLDALGNNGVFGSSNLPASFQRDQRLGLEGDFDEHFALYCPEGYERDALYLFTPDIMSRFMDNAAELDVEIVDDWLFLYAKRDFSTIDPHTWAWLFSVVGALLGKLSQWGRWRDERLEAETVPGGTPPAADGHADAAHLADHTLRRPPRGVARGGRRLKRSTSWTWIVILLAFGGWWFLSTVLPALQR